MRNARNKKIRQIRRRRRLIRSLIRNVAAVALVAAAGWISIKMLLPSGNDMSGNISPAITPRPLITVDPYAGDLVTPTPAPTEPGVVIQGWTSVKVPASATESNVSLYNPEENAGWYDLTFELRLKETDEIIFTTGLIPPGQYCNKVMLSRPLEPGIYPAILHVQPYYMNEEQTPTNDLNMDVRLIVE